MILQALSSSRLARHTLLTAASMAVMSTASPLPAAAHGMQQPAHIHQQAGEESKGAERAVVIGSMVVALLTRNPIMIMAATLGGGAYFMLDYAAQSWKGEAQAEMSTEDRAFAGFQRALGSCATVSDPDDPVFTIKTGPYGDVSFRLDNDRIMPVHWPRWPGHSRARSDFDPVVDIIYRARAQSYRELAPHMSAREMPAWVDADFLKHKRMVSLDLPSGAEAIEGFETQLAAAFAETDYGPQAISVSYGESGIRISGAEGAAVESLDKTAFAAALKAQGQRFADQGWGLDSAPPTPDAAVTAKNSAKPKALAVS